MVKDLGLLRQEGYGSQLEMAARGRRQMEERNCAGEDRDSVGPQREAVLVPLSTARGPLHGRYWSGHLPKLCDTHTQWKGDPGEAEECRGVF